MRNNILVLMALFVHLAGCSGVQMKESEVQSLPVLESGKSRVVFMRSSPHGTPVEAAMYEVVNNSPKFIGILNNENKIYMDKAPGRYEFMSRGTKGLRFMSATLSPGKTYYVVATPRGWPMITFSLYPVRTDGTGKFEMDTDEVNEIIKSTTLVELSPEATEWSKKMAPLVNRVFEKEWPLWKSKPDTFKENFTFMKDDGV